MKLRRSIIALMAIGALGATLAGCSNSHHASQHESQTSVSRESNKKVTHKTKKSHTKKATKDNKPLESNNQNNSHHVKNINLKKSSNTAQNTNNSNSDSLPTVDLGNGIHAHEDHGAGQTYLSFNVDGHNVVVHGSNFGNGNQVAINKAHNIINHVNQLPASQKNVNVNATIQ